MNKERLDEIIRLHKLWLDDKEGGVRADLGDTDLSYAILSNADLSGAKGLKGIARLDFGDWSDWKIYAGREITSIGCATKESTWWLQASDEEIAGLDGDALAWWKQYGEAVKAVIKATMEEHD